MRWYITISPFVLVIRKYNILILVYTYINRNEKLEKIIIRQVYSVNNGIELINKGRRVLWILIVRIYGENLKNIV